MRAPQPEVSELEKAVRRNDVGAVEALLRNGADIHEGNGMGRDMLNLAAGEGHLEMARFLIANGAEVNRKNWAGNTPLILAASWGHIELVHFLVEKGADVRICNSSGRTAIEEIRSNDLLIKFLSKTLEAQCRRAAEAEARAARAEKTHALTVGRQRVLKLRAPKVIIRRPRP